MSILPDSWIADQEGMIEPFVDHQVTDGVISYGLSSYGYDLRVASEFLVMGPGQFGSGDFAITRPTDYVVDPKEFDTSALVKIRRHDACLIPPNSFALSHSVERFQIPRDVLGICVGKSTLARCGIIVNTTPLEPTWEGQITLEISNTTPYPAKIYADEGIAQVLFFESSGECSVAYAEREHARYQHQRGIVPPGI